ncbi:hypothetical protein RhiLY_02342 [Ceratobasidium sp. AG-Ba]|nr:hypothetical protein RhiLY_02342 [Ceratobasidium sp. AG-Ba]
MPPTRRSARIAESRSKPTPAPRKSKSARAVSKSKSTRTASKSKSTDEASNSKSTRRKVRNPVFVCPVCSEMLPFDTLLMRRHTQNGCGRVIDLLLLREAIECHQRSSSYNYEFISIEELYGILDKVAGSREWRTRVDMDLLLERFGDLDIIGPAGCEQVN